MAQYKGTSSDGNRVRMGDQKRLKEKADFERQKKELKDFGSEGLKPLDSLFNSRSSQSEMLFKQETVGFMNLEDFKKAKKKKEDREKDESKGKKKKKKRKKKEQQPTLSFGIDEFDDEPENNEIASPSPEKKKKKSLKNPDVDTSFLPDKARDEEEALERQRLEEEWDTRQEEMKKEAIEITYSYWDGSGHRRTIKVEKGFTIGKFLENVRLDLSRQFSELRHLLAENLMYIKEDLIVPHNYTFYDLIVTKARGKSGPLFHFDVHDDVRMFADARVEKDESHAGKVITRSWYERNKHIFPASRWEVYDPSVVRDKYTIA